MGCDRLIPATIIASCLVFAAGALRHACWVKERNGDFPQDMLLVRK